MKYEDNAVEKLLISQNLLHGDHKITSCPTKEEFKSNLKSGVVYVDGDGVIDTNV